MFLKIGGGGRIDTGMLKHKTQKYKATHTVLGLLMSYLDFYDSDHV